MNDRTSLLILGLDGVNFDLLHRLLPPATMPTLNQLIAEGSAGDLTSVFPTHSASAWSSFMTGQTPAGHGVFDFKVRLPDGHYRHARPEPQTTLWHVLGQSGYSVGVFNFPVTFPPNPVNGWMVSGMLSPDLQHFTHPAELAVELTNAFPGYVLDVEWMLYKDRPADLLQDLTAMVHQRGEVARFLWDRYPVDVFAVAFIATDRGQHALWRYLDPQHPTYDEASAAALHPAIVAFYKALDDAVAGLLELANAETTVVALSDHGFQAAAWQFHVDDWLEQNGWLGRRAASRRVERLVRRFEPPLLRQVRQRLFPDVSRYVPAFTPGGALDWARTRAYGPWNFHQGVRMNMQGRDPHGVVPPEDYERLRDEISGALSALRHPESGAPVIASLYHTEALYDGPFLSAMPDLVFDLHSNFAPGIHRQELFEPTGWVSGDHSLNGFIALRGPGIQPGSLQSAHLVDVAPTIYYLLGLPIPGFVQGRVLENLTPGMAGSHPAPSSQSRAENASPTGDLTAEEEQKLLRQLRDLGYC